MEKDLLGLPGLSPGAPRSGQMPSSLELAFVGDTVYDLYARSRVLRAGGRMKQLHLNASHLVCAAAQSEALSRIESMLTEAEQAIVRRARNAKQTPPRNADPAAYHRATAMEALLGQLYLTGQIERLDELMRTVLEE